MLISRNKSLFEDKKEITKYELIHTNVQLIQYEGTFIIRVLVILKMACFPVCVSKSYNHLHVSV